MNICEYLNSVDEWGDLANIIHHYTYCTHKEDIDALIDQLKTTDDTHIFFDMLINFIHQDGYDECYDNYYFKISKENGG